MHLISTFSFSYFSSLKSNNKRLRIVVAEVYGLQVESGVLEELT